MSSRIDAAQPLPAVPPSKGAMRANFAAAKAEIEALQGCALIDTAEPFVTVNAAAFGPGQRHGEVVVLMRATQPSLVTLADDVPVGRAVHVARDGGFDVFVAAGSLRPAPAGVAAAVTEAGASAVFRVMRNPDGLSAEWWQIAGSTADPSGPAPTPPPPSLTAAAPAVVAPGDAIAVTAAHGPGGRFDWVGLFPAANPDPANPIARRYLSDDPTNPPETGLVGATLSFTAPAGIGDYVLHWYADDSTDPADLIAASGVVTVLPPPVADYDFEALAFTGTPQRPSLSGANTGLWLQDHLGVYRQVLAAEWPLEGHERIDRGDGVDYGFGAPGIEYVARAGGGLRIQRAATNKVTAAKSNPAATTNCTPSGDAAGVLTVVDGSALAGFAALAAFGPNVYRLDNSAGAAAFYVRFGGPTGDTAKHSLSAFVLGQGTLLLYDGATTETGATTFDHAAFTRVLVHNLTPANTAQELTVKVAAGQVAHVIVPQLEAITAVTSPIGGATGAAARDQVLVSGPVFTTNVAIVADATADAPMVAENRPLVITSVTGHAVLLVRVAGNLAESYDGASNLSASPGVTPGERFRAAVTAGGTTRRLVIKGGAVATAGYNNNAWSGRTAHIVRHTVGSPGAPGRIHRVTFRDQLLAEATLQRLTA